MVEREPSHSFHPRMYILLYPETQNKIRTRFGWPFVLLKNFKVHIEKDAYIEKKVVLSLSVGAICSLFSCWGAMLFVHFRQNWPWFMLDSGTMQNIQEMTDLGCSWFHEMMVHAHIIWEPVGGLVWERIFCLHVCLILSGGSYTYMVFFHPFPQSGTSSALK